MKQLCEQQWKQGSKHQYESCGIDAGIYTNGHSLRLAGFCKPPESKDDVPRFLRPCLVTTWWENRLPKTLLAERELLKAIPSVRVRRAWTRASLLLLPAPPKANIRVPSPLDVKWKEPRRDSENTVLPPPTQVDREEPEWIWTLNTELYPYPDPARRARGFNSSTTNNNGTVLMDIEEDNENEDCFIYILEDGEVTKYERQGGEWRNSKTNSRQVRGDIATLKVRAFSKVKDKFAQYWNIRVDMRREAKIHMEACGYQGSEEEEKQEEEYDFQIDEYISILYLTNFTQGRLFTASNVTLDPRFKVITGSGDVVNLEDIEDKTQIFCPKHEIDEDFDRHRPSAFADIDCFGRHIIFCPACASSSVKETWQDNMETETWADLQQKYGDDWVRFINEDYIRLRHLLRLRKKKENRENNDEGNIVPVNEDNGEDIDKRRKEEDKKYDVMSQHSAYARTHYHEINIIISPMGSGKTSMLNDLVEKRVHFIKKKLNIHALEPPTILAISPRRDLAKFMARKFGLACYFDDESLQNQWDRIFPNLSLPNSKNKLLCALPWLAICINSLGRLEERKNEGYDIMILDEFATTALSLLAEHMHEYVKRIMEILQSLMINSKIVRTEG